MGAVAGAGLVEGCGAPATALWRTPDVTKDQRIIRGKVGLLELGKQLGNVSQALP